MKKSFLILLFASLALTGCNNTPPVDSGDESGSDPSPGPGPAPDAIPSGEYTKTIKLSGEEFSSFSDDSGKQVNNTDHSKEKGELLTYLQSKVDYETMVSELDCIKINTAEWDTKAALCVGTGYYLNDKFSEGSFKWSSDVKIYHVQVKARAYTKNNSGVIQVDEPAKIQIDDGEICPLLGEGETTASVKPFEADYPDGTDCFTIKSYDARVVLQEITITWKA